MATSIEQVLADDYLGDIDQLSVDALRDRRHECSELELGLSYFRRLVQGRLDIVHAELARRAGGSRSTDVGDLIGQLPSILADSTRSTGRGQFPDLGEPPDVDALVADLNTIIDAHRLASLPDQSDEEVRSVADRLTDLERSVSTRRRALLDRIDALQAQIVQRYKTGEATVDALLG